MSQAGIDPTLVNFPQLGVKWTFIQILSMANVYHSFQTDATRNAATFTPPARTTTWEELSASVPKAVPK
jgi:hypothetical protein